MARIPVYNREVTTGAAARTLHLPHEELAGVKMLRDMGNITGAAGQAASNVAGHIFSEVEKAEQNQLQKSLIDLDNYIADRQYNPENGLYANIGDNALGKTDIYLKDIDTYANQLLRTLPQNTQDQFNAQYAVKNLQVKRSGLAFENQQTLSARDSNRKASIELDIQSNGMAYGDNESFDIGLQAMMLNIETSGRKMGLTDAEIRLEQQNSIRRSGIQGMNNAMALMTYPELAVAIGEPSDIAGLSRNVGLYKGQLEKGNINLANRPQVKNVDGSVSTVLSMSVNVDDQEVLIPMVSDDGKILTEEQAIARYKETGNHLGKFDSVESASAYAEALHSQQEQQISGPKSRGTRNNNPGNIRISKNNWQGQAGNDGEFVTFATPEHGIRALGKNLLSYQRLHGLDTIESIVKRWAPPNENETGDYVAFVARQTGFSRNEKIDLTNLDTLTKLTKAIILQENGVDEVSKKPRANYSDEQISNGLKAALGYSSLAAPLENQELPDGTKLYAIHPSRLTQLAAFNVLDPSDQAQYLRMFEQKRDGDKAERQNSVKVRLDAIYAAHGKGLSPSESVSDDEIYDAFGEGSRGQTMVSDLRLQEGLGRLISLGTDLSIEGRQQLLAESRPMPDDGPYYDRRIQKWEQVKQAFEAMDERDIKRRYANNFELSVQQGFLLDPTDKNNQIAADSFFDSKMSANFNLENEESRNQVALVSTKTGLIPSQVKSLMVTAGASKDPSIVMPIAKLFGDIFDNNPAAVKEFDPKTQAYYSKIYALNRAGMSDVQAIDFAYDVTYKQSDEVKEIIKEKLRDKDYIKARDDAAQGFVKDKSGGFFSYAPDASDPSVSNRQFSAEYKLLFDTNYGITGGDVKQAEKLTNAQIANTWGISKINGKKEIMKYAPEALYGNNSSWIKDQWELEKKELAQNWFGGMPKDADFILMPDAGTPRDMAYSIISTHTDVNGVIQYGFATDSKGRIQRFKPDQKTSPAYLELIEQRQGKVADARRQREEKQTPPSPYSHLSVLFDPQG